MESGQEQAYESASQRSARSIHHLTGTTCPPLRGLRSLLWTYAVQSQNLPRFLKCMERRFPLMDRGANSTKQGPFFFRVESELGMEGTEPFWPNVQYCTAWLHDREKIETVFVKRNTLTQSLGVFLVHEH